MVKSDALEMLLNTLFEGQLLKSWSIFVDKNNEDTIVKIRFDHNGRDETHTQTTYCKKSNSQLRRDQKRGHSHKKRKISQTSIEEARKHASDLTPTRYSVMDSPENVYMVDEHPQSAVCMNAVSRTATPDCSQTTTTLTQALTLSHPSKYVTTLPSALPQMTPPSMPPITLQPLIPIAICSIPPSTQPTTTPISVPITKPPIVSELSFPVCPCCDMPMYETAHICREAENGSEVAKEEENEIENEEAIKELLLMGKEIIDRIEQMNHALEPGPP